MRSPTAAVSALALIVAVLVGCSAPAAAGTSPGPTGAALSIAPIADDFPDPPATAPADWTSLVETGPSSGVPTGIGSATVLAAVPFRGGFVAVGTDDGVRGPVTGTIWSTPDGVTWSPAADADGSLAGASLWMIATDGEVLLAVGGVRAVDSGDPGPMRTIWRSSDGRTWTQLPDHAPGLEGVMIRGLVGNDSGFVAFGELDDRTTVVLRSGDGTSWRRATLDASFEGATINDLQPYRGGYVAVGAKLYTPGPGEVLTIGGPDRSKARAWRSPDGLTWHAADVADGSGLGQVVVGADGLLAVGGGGCGSCVSPGYQWHSSDGKTWRPVGFDPAGWPSYGSDGSRIVMVGRPIASRAQWSADGLSWHPLAGDLSSHAVMGGPVVTPNGILLVQGIPKGGPIDPADAAVRYLTGH